MISSVRTKAATARAARTGAVSARPTPARSVVRRYKEGEHDVVHEANQTLSGEWPATWALKGFEDQVEFYRNQMKAKASREENDVDETEALKAVHGEWPAAASWSVASYQDLVEYYESKKEKK